MTRTGLIVFLLASGCATAFQGSAHVEGGRSGCASKCAGQGMQVAGMVFMGEYSSACICEAPRATSSSDHRRLLGGAAAATGGAVGVVMQQRRQQQQAVMQQQATMPHRY